jgi:hypothetical protein
MKEVNPEFPPPAKLEAVPVLNTIRPDAILAAGVCRIMLPELIVEPGPEERMMDPLVAALTEPATRNI